MALTVQLQFICIALCACGGAVARDISNEQNVPVVPIPLLVWGGEKPVKDLYEVPLIELPNQILAEADALERDPDDLSNPHDMPLIPIPDHLLDADLPERDPDDLNPHYLPEYSAPDNFLTDISDQPIETDEDFLIKDPPMGIDDLAVVTSAGCQIVVNGGLPDLQPLFLHPGEARLMHPQTRNGIVTLNPGQVVEVFCSGAGFAPPYTNTNFIFATCVTNDQFSVNGQVVPFNTLNCSVQVGRTARRSPQQTCLQNATEIQLGFRVDPQRFISIMDICHDEVLQSTHYARYYQTPSNMGFQRSFPRPSFITGSFFGGKNVDRLYTGVVQRQTIAGILGQSRVDQLFDNDRDFFLARGHLAARADYIYGTEQRATFYFVNVAPQWQSFNAGNWERIEAGLRNFVANRNMNTEIYTGTFGVAELRDVNGINRQIFLSNDGNNNGQIPVPQYFYKVVIGERFRRGVVFIGLNNPHVTREEVNTGRYDLCKDVSDQITFVNWNRSNLNLGYVYACDVNEFIKVVSHLPRSMVTSGLLV